MESRLLTLSSVQDFHYLLNITPLTEVKKLLADYADQLATVINTADDVAQLFKNLDNPYVEAEINQTIITAYPHILFGAIKTVDDVLPFILQDHGSCFRELITKAKTDFLKHLLSLLVQLKDVLTFVEALREVVGFDYDKFHFEVPHAKDLVLHPEYFDRLCRSNSSAANYVVMVAANSLIGSQDPNIALIVRLAQLHKDKFSYPHTRKWKVRKSRKCENLEKGEWLLSKFQQWLQSDKGQAVIAAFSQRENFLALYTANHTFATILLEYGKLDLVTILFDGKLTITDLYEFSQTHPALGKEVCRYYTQRGKDLVALLHSAGGITLFSMCNNYRDDWLESMSIEDRRTLARVFVTTAILPDWIWLASGSRFTNKLSLLADCVHEEDPSPQMKGVFSSVQPFMRLAETKNPIFLSKMIKQLENDKSSNDQCVDVASLFSDRYQFLDFLRKVGYAASLANFAMNVFVKFPRHLAFVYHRTNCFIDLGEEFARSIDIAAIRFTDDLVFLDPLTLNQYIQNDCDKLLPLINLVVFEQLRFEHRLLLIKQAPDAIAALYNSGEANFSSLIDLLSCAQFQYSCYEPTQKLCDMFKRAPATFARLFMLGEPALRKKMIEQYPIFTDIIFSHCPKTMAVFYGGEEFVALFKTARLSAVLLLNSCKDLLHILIPTAADLAAINAENPKLMERFALQYPNEAAAHLAAISTAAPAASSRTALHTFGFHAPSSSAQTADQLAVARPESGM